LSKKAAAVDATIAVGDIVQYESHIIRRGVGRIVYMGGWWAGLNDREVHIEPIKPELKKAGPTQLVRVSTQLSKCKKVVGS